MEFKSLDQIKSDADVAPDIARVAPMSKRQRLERWAELLDGQQGRWLRSIDGTEFGTRAERESKRADGSPLTVAFQDPLLRAQGLSGDRVGDAIAFFGLSHRELHHLVCYCHYGRSISAAVVADNVRTLARHADGWTLPRGKTVFAGLSAAAAVVLATAVL